MSARIVVLPMLGQQDDCNLAIGCIEITGEIGRVPRRFTIESAKIEHVARANKTSTMTEMVALMGQPEQEFTFAEPPAPFTPPRPTQGVPYLRLVKG